MVKPYAPDAGEIVWIDFAAPLCDPSKTWQP
jgi:hypothetical protein